MDIHSISIEGEQVTFLFRGDSKAAAQLRDKIMNDIKFKLIDEVVFNKNTSNLNNEKIAHRLGLLVVKDTDNIGILNIKGPKKVKAKHIKGLDVVHPDALLLQLTKDEELNCNLIVKEGSGRIHKKWNPVYAITFEKNKEGEYLFTLGLIGVLTFDQILEQL